MSKPYRVEVVADRSGEFCGNALRFDFIDDASLYAIDLASRWTAVRAWRVVNNAGLIVAASTLKWVGGEV